MPYGITSGPGGMWFTESSGDRVGRITAAGEVTEFSAGLTPNGRPTGIATGADGNLWVAQEQADSIARITPSRHRDRFRPRRPARVRSR